MLFHKIAPKREVISHCRAHYRHRLNLTMKFSPKVKRFPSSLLITLLFSLQLTACNNKDIVERINNNIATGTPGGSETISSGAVDNSFFADIYLSWTAPSEREDNHPITLSEIAGYKVYYGTKQRNYSDSVDIKDGTANEHTFKNVSPGTYYFTLTSYDTAGRESRYSSEIKIVV